MSISFHTSNIIRLAMPVPVPDDIKQKMKEDKVFVNPTGGDDKPPEVLKGDWSKVSQETLLTLPKIYYANKPEDIRVIDGKPYLIVEVDQSKKYTRPPKNLALTSHPIHGDNWYPGKVVAINIETGDLAEFTYDAVEPILKQQASAISEKTRQEANEQIKLYNERLSKIDKASTSLTQLPLQFSRLVSAIDERLMELTGQAESTSDKKESEKIPGSLTDWNTWLDQQIASANLGENDFVDSIFYRYMYRYEELSNDLKSGKIPMPSWVQDAEAMKTKLIALADLAATKYKEKKEKDKQPKVPTQDFSILDRDIQEIPSIPEGGVPTSQKSTGYSSPDSRGKSYTATGLSVEDNIKKLTELKDAIVAKSKEIGSLPSGFRTNESLRTNPEGIAYVQQLKQWFDDVLGKFVLNYQRDIIKPTGEINSALFGRKGTAGNASLAVFVTRVYAAGKNFLLRLLSEMDAGAQKQVIDGVPAPMSTPAPQSTPAVPADDGLKGLND